MLNYLRFTRADYEAIADACSPHVLRAGSLRAFRSRLVDALGPAHPQLADRLADLRMRQVRILYKFVVSHSASGEWVVCRPPERTSAAAGELTLQEWQTLAKASDAFWLHDASIAAFWQFLLQNVSPKSPVLATKLARFTEGQIVKLYQRVKSGVRWCG
jgi:hypothetical protein